MPRSAATIIGLTLVAFSIGFNTQRYPVVWDMVNPARANHADESVQTAQPEMPEGPVSVPTPPSPTTPPANPIKTTEVQPVPDIAEGITVGNSLVATTSPVIGDEATSTLGGNAVERDAQKPLVPVTQVSSPNAPNNGAVGGAGIRRLPPVDRLHPAESPTATWSGGSIPIYPTTGIQ